MKTWIDRLLGIKNDNKPADSRASRGVGGDGCTSRPDDAYEGFNAGDVVSRMLRDIQASWETREYNDRGDLDFHFNYQRGDFHLLTSDERHQARLHFLFFHETGVGQLDNVRHVCNLFNQQYPDFKAIYSIDSKQHKMHIHLITNIRLTMWNQALEDDFAATLTLCFEAARTFRWRLAEITESDVNNLEERQSFREREIYLAYETEMEHQDALWHTNSTSHLKLHDLVAMALGTDNVEYELMGIQLDDLLDETNAAEHRRQIIGHDEIADFDVTGLMVSESDENPNLAHIGATLTVYAKIFGESFETFIVHIAPDLGASDVLFFRVTFVRTDKMISPSSSRTSRLADDGRVSSFVMSYSRTSQAELQAEFDYMWREARERREKGLELSDEQRFILLSEEADVDFNLYWGLRLYLSKQHYRALLYFENAYHALKVRFHLMDRQERQQFFELAYFIGQCYMHLNMPRQAYYYLDGLFNHNNIRYTQAYINAIVKAHDYRALGVVDGVLSNVKRVYDEEHDASEDQRSDLLEFILFLRRSKARVLINEQRLDDAEKVLRDLLPDDNRHEAYLLEQLAHVAHLRAEAASQALNRDTLSVSTEFPKADTHE